MITFENVTKHYPNHSDALDKVSFQLPTGEMAFLTGHSGAGKSTILKLITLAERSSLGEVTVGNYKLSKVSSRQVPYLRRSMGIIFQSPRLLNDRTIFDNVALPLVIAGHHRHLEVGRLVRAALSKVGLSGIEKKYPLELSGGEQQRVGIARAVVNKPPLLLADEPTGNLDPQLSREIMNLFEQFNQVGVTVLIASHDLSLIMQMQHRILKLRNGQLVNGSKEHG